MNTTVIDKSVLEQTLAILEAGVLVGGSHPAITAIREALARPVQEPVAWADQISFDQAMESGKGHDVWPNAGDYEVRTGRKLRALYTQPPRREWQGMSLAELNALPEIGDVSWRMGTAQAVLRAIRATEKALKKKNS